MSTTELEPEAPAQTPQANASEALIASVHESLTQAAKALKATAQAHQELAEALRTSQEVVRSRRRAPGLRLWKRS